MPTIEHSKDGFLITHDGYNAALRCMIQGAWRGTVWMPYGVEGIEKDADLTSPWNESGMTVRDALVELSRTPEDYGGRIIEDRGRVV